METFAQSPLDEVYCIPHDGAYIVYFPLLGVAISASASIVNELSEAISSRRPLPDAVAQVVSRDAHPISLQPAFGSAAGRRTFRPVDVSLFLTSACTLRCIYCYAHGGENPKSMSLQMVEAVAECMLRNALSTGRKRISVNFHGGGDISAAWELFCRSCEHIHLEAGKVGLSVRFSLGTNGVLDAGQRDWIVRHIHSATISLDGPAHIQDAQRPTARGGSSFARVDETLRAFDEAGFHYGIRCTITDRSVGILDGIVGFICERYRARSIKAEPLCLSGRARSSDCQPPQAEEFVMRFRRAREVAVRHGRQLTYSAARLETVSQVFCMATAGSCCVTPDGYLTSCYEVVDPTNPLADTFLYGRLDLEARDFVVDWKRLDVLRTMRFLHTAFCANCFCRWNCAGDCPAKRLGHDGTGEYPDAARCYITRELTKDQLLELVRGGAEEGRSGSPR